MAKKEVKEKLKKGIKKIYSESKGKVIALVGDLLEDQLTNLIEWIKDLTRIKTIIRKCFISTILGIAATTVLLLGIANTLVYYYPDIIAGFWQIIVGVVAIAGILFYMKK